MPEPHPPAPLVRIHTPALPEAAFRRLLRAVRSVGDERLRQTYQTTFWFDLATAPTNVVDEAALELRRYIPRSERVVGVEWWLSRMSPNDVRVDFHQDRDEKLALAGGPLVHPLVSSVLFLNRVKGGALAVTAEPPCEANPSLAPAILDFDLVAPHPNRFAVFAGDLTHGVLDAKNDIPAGRLPGTARRRLTIAINWWDHRPTGVPTFPEAGVYRPLAAGRRRGGDS
ncbi:hypothetical protein [Vulgatibacter sp.]|uniref:hypothetical protein n=1 Tax=Vulgatibacter sp. TaxID=1971226 RepID=UPI003565676D